MDASHQLPSKLVPHLIDRFSSQEAYSLYPDVLPFFEALRNRRSIGTNDPFCRWKTIVVGVITNSDDRVPRILESLGLVVGSRTVEDVTGNSTEGSPVEDISSVVLSYDVGYEKPDRRIFEAAKELFVDIMGSETSNEGIGPLENFELVYIGDDLKKDVWGARNAGWNSILLDREGNHKERFRAGNDIAAATISEEDWGINLGPVQIINDLKALSSWKPMYE